MLTDRFAEILEILDSSNPDRTKPFWIYTHESYELSQRGLIDNVGNMTLVTPKGRSTLVQYKVLKSIENLFGVQDKFITISSREISENTSMEIYRINHILLKLYEENYIEVEYDQNKNLSILKITDKGSVALNYSSDLVHADYPNIKNNDFRGSNFGGGVAIGDGAIQIGGINNNYSQTINNNLDEIIQLIDVLRSQARSFPQKYQEEVEDHLIDLESDLRKPEKRGPNRIKASLLALLTVAGVISGRVATGTDFANNVLELSKKFGIELVQTQSSQHAKPSDVKKISPD
jgi:DNA-binding MarR family transcriptional regulator